MDGQASLISTETSPCPLVSLHWAGAIKAGEGVADHRNLTTNRLENAPEKRPHRLSNRTQTRREAAEQTAGVQDQAQKFQQSKCSGLCLLRGGGLGHAPPGAETQAVC